MNSLFSFVFYFPIGTIIVVGIGVFIQLKQQSKSKENNLKSNDIS